MADKENKTPLNVVGKFYNDDSCIDCGMCPEIAPNTFARDDDEGVSYVWKQPKSEADVESVMEAMENCPTESIGMDGSE